MLTEQNSTTTTVERREQRRLRQKIRRRLKRYGLQLRSAKSERTFYGKRCHITVHLGNYILTRSGRVDAYDLDLNKLACSFGLK
jgi:hypothetical protein